VTFDYNNIFEQDVPQTVEEARKKAEDAALAIKAVGEGARACINTESFQAYKRSFENAQEKIIEAMISYTHNFFQENDGDMAVYGANMARFVTKVQDLKALLISVENDAQKGKK
jgi:hypothetical protein